MALVEFPNKIGMIISPFTHYTMTPSFTPFTAMAAVGRSIGFIGRIYLTSGSGTSKIISSAGGKIWFSVSSVTWATAGTTLRVGIQDVNATGIEDGIFDVYDDLIQGTDALVVAIKEVIMSSGTKTITHGDLIAISVEMTIRNGADTVSVNRINDIMNFPYSTLDTGAGPIKTAGAPYCIIKFDDGTIGHFGDWMIPITETLQSFNSGSTPDEYAIIFQFPFKCTINGLYVRLQDVDAGETATMHLIKDPLGAITNLQTVTLDPAFQAQASTTAASSTIVEITETILEANTIYGISYRPTSTGNRAIRLIGLADTSFRLATIGQFQGANRTDLGAFSISSTVIPDIGIRINKLDDGASSNSVAYVG